MESVNARIANAGTERTHPDRRHVQLEPAVVLPVQMQSPRMADASLVPEKLLMLAVLEEAIATFQRHAADTGRRGRRLFHEAEAWLLSEEREWPCSFRNICDALGLDVGYLRGGLTRWRDERRRNPVGMLPFPPRFRRLSGSRTRAVGRPIGLRRSVPPRDELPPQPPG
jgi:hypothetical protein